MSMGEQEALEQAYERMGFGSRGVTGIGSHPAILVVDMFCAFTDPDSSLYIPCQDAVAAAAELLEVGRAAAVPSFHSIMRYASVAEAPAFIAKAPLLLRLRPGNAYDKFDDRLFRPDDAVIDKKGASCFHGTHLHGALTGLGIDTVIVVGMSTSGCVRATVVDAVQNGFRVLVPRECVADRLELPHNVSLADMDSRYADVVSVADVSSALKERLVVRQSTPAHL
jgi:nicotinamidase-related amidase